MADTLTDGQFAEYCRASRDRLVAAGTAFCGNRQQAEDAVQEALIEAMKQWDTIHGKDAWLHRVMYRKLIDDARKWRTRLWRQHPDSELPLPASCPSDLRESVLAVLGAVNRLPVRQRQVVHLHAAGWTSEEVAALLGIRVSTVRSNLRHARERLRLLLDIPPGIDSCGDWLDTAVATDPVAGRLREVEEWLALGLRAQRLAEGGGR